MYYTHLESSHWDPDKIKVYFFILKKIKVK